MKQDGEFEVGLDNHRKHDRGLPLEAEKLDQPFFQILCRQKSQQLPLCCFVFVRYPEVHKQIIGGVQLH